MEERFIGNYKILKKIGAGGMARVYLAVHKDVPNLRVVLKILTDPRLVERFKQEADKLALLDGHPNICRIKHFFNHGDDFVIAMEYIDGVTLDEKVKKNGRLPISESLRIISDVLAILEAAHQKDIYHRDIKPGNIMIDRDGNVKIIDFGIAKGKSDPNLTVTGTACGTPAYMAPEQFTPTENINYALVDIYAAGITLFHLLTGKLPFEGENEFILRDAKLHSEPAKPRKLNPEIPKELEAIILKSLQKKPENRFKSASEMQEALTTLCKEQKKVPTDETAALAAYEATGKKSKRLPIVAAVVIIIALASFSIYKFLLSEREPSASAGAPDTLIEYGETSPQTPLVSEGEIRLTIVPSGDVYFDGNLIGMGISGTSLISDTGRHIIRLENSDAINRLIIDTISLAAGEELQRRYSFEFPATPSPKPEAVVGTGKVLVGSRPRGADIYIDGRYQEHQTPYTFTLNAGQHIVKVELETGGEILVHIDTVIVTKDGTHKVFLNTEE